MSQAPSPRQHEPHEPSTSCLSPHTQPHVRRYAKYAEALQQTPTLLPEASAAVQVLHLECARPFNHGNGEISSI